MSESSHTHPETRHSSPSPPPLPEPPPQTMTQELEPAPPTLSTIPPEILEHIAVFTASDPFLGPPTAIAALRETCRTIAAALGSVQEGGEEVGGEGPATCRANPHLYARVFACKFDVGAVGRRGVGMGEGGKGKKGEVDARALGCELKRRCMVLMRIRRQLDARIRRAPSSISAEGPASPPDTSALYSLLWTAYIMVLENDGKNEAQLRGYAGIDEWLRVFWFGEDGASGARRAVGVGLWPREDEECALAMWLFWLLLRIGDYTKTNQAFYNATSVLKVLALAAHQYNLAIPSWIEFMPTSTIIVAAPSCGTIMHYSEPRRLRVPPLATPAILSFLTLNALAHDMRIGMGVRVGAGVVIGIGGTVTGTSADSVAFTKAKADADTDVPLTVQDSREWECEWERCRSLGRVHLDSLLTPAFRPGSIEGMWEGIFTYTEFTAYAALLSGAPPATLQDCLVGQHRQTWKLREHHLVALDDDGSYSHSGSKSDADLGIAFRSACDKDSDDSVTRAVGCPPPLAPGPPLRSFFPSDTVLREDAAGLEVWPGSMEKVYYRRPAEVAVARERMQGQGQRQMCEEDGGDGVGVRDVIITGEGHSAWGQFNLKGRVRPCDGFISLSKEYSGGDRGMWLYRGYLVGNVNGQLAGRWRDTLSLPEDPGYEGCFMMSRRR